MNGRVRFGPRTFNPDVQEYVEERIAQERYDALPDSLWSFGNGPRGLWTRLKMLRPSHYRYIQSMVREAYYEIRGHRETGETQ